MTTKLRRDAMNILIDLIEQFNSVEADGDYYYDLDVTILLDDILDNIDVFVKLAQETHHNEEFEADCL